MHVLGSCEASAQYSPINFFVNLFHSKNSNLPDCFSDLIHTEYRKLHKNNGHSPFVSPSIMRSSVGQCRNIRFRQLSASHVIITSEYLDQYLHCSRNKGGLMVKLSATNYTKCSIRRRKAVYSKSIIPIRPWEQPVSRFMPNKHF